jgi:N-acetylmuramoyl-L-alanine amidase
MSTGVTPPPNPRRSITPNTEQPIVSSLLEKPLEPYVNVKKAPRIIVIDAGHGGVDPGAITANGVYEKSIVLDTSKRLQAVLSKDVRYKVVMTRDSDVFVRLSDRVQIARNSRASLFVSIHADALATRKVRGASVYTLSEQASDKEAELLAAKENNSDMIAGIGIGDETDELVKSILIDLAQRETTNKSVHFAKLLLPELNDVGALLKNSHRYAGFRVLKAPDVPSVLIELGLLSNNTDARILTSSAGRQKLAEALKQAIDTYFRNFET